MHNTLAPWTGDPFIIPATEPAPSPAATGRTRHWSFQIGRNGLIFSSTIEDHRPCIVAPVNERRSAIALTTAAVAGGLALLLVGASAGRAWSPAPVPSAAAMIVPMAKPVPTPTASLRSPPARRVAAGQAFPTVVPERTQDEPTPAGGLDRAAAIRRALGTGEFQEWTGGDGTTGFAVAGPAETTAQGSCRALAVLTRKIDGSDSVASSRECQPAVAKD